MNLGTMLVLTGCLLGQADDPALKTVIGVYEKREFKDPKVDPFTYFLHKPDQYDPAKKYPLLVWLHGGAPKAGTVPKPGVVGELDWQQLVKHPCFLLIPKSPPSKYGWAAVHHSTGSHKLPAGPSDQIRLAIESIEKTLKEFPAIDPDRVWIAGASYGGYGTWEIIARRPELFAAAVPICGGGDPAQAQRIAKLPIWAFHGDKDNLVPVVASRDMIAALKKAGGDPKYTEMAGVGHSAWANAFKTPELYAWLFAQKRSKL